MNPTFDFHALDFEERQKVERLIVDAVRLFPELTQEQVGRRFGIDEYVIADILRKQKFTK